MGNDKDGVTGVRLQSTVGEPELTKEISGFFPAIGHTPNTQFLEGQLELKPNQYIKWTTPMRTLPAWRAFLRPATWPTTTTARR